MNRRTFLATSLLTAGAMILLKPLANGRGAGAYAVATPQHKPRPQDWSDEELTMSWIGHSTVLINFYGTWILTDPVFSDRVGVYVLGTNIGPSRYTHPALSIAETPKPDLILLSHAHMDHMDYRSLAILADTYPNEIDVITAANTMDVIEGLPWRSLNELDWRRQTRVNGLDIRALEVKHFGWRYPWEKDRSRGFTESGRSFNAYLLERYDKKIVFGGDTAMCEHFRELNHLNIDVAIMPIGAYNPWHSRHCTPEEALEMAGHMNARIFVPIHTNTFRQGREALNEPMRRMAVAAHNQPIEIGIGGLGQTLLVSS